MAISFFYILLLLRLDLQWKRVWKLDRKSLLVNKWSSLIGRAWSDMSSFKPSKELQHHSTYCKFFNSITTRKSLRSIKSIEVVPATIVIPPAASPQDRTVLGGSGVVVLVSSGESHPVDDSIRVWTRREIIISIAWTADEMDGVFLDFWCQKEERMLLRNPLNSAGIDFNS